MQKSIASPVVKAYSLCPRKAFLLLHPEDNPPREPHEYVDILEKRTDRLRAELIHRLKEQRGGVRPYEANALRTGIGHLVNATLQSRDLKAQCDLLTKVKRTSALGRYSYEPAIVIGTRSVPPEEKVALSFGGIVLAELQNHLPVNGTVLSPGGKTHRIRLPDTYRTTRGLIETLRGWIAQPGFDPPPVILNRHCPVCPFRKECKDRAIKADDLSLLDRVTPKVRHKFHKKGIFTIEQLSYLFRPRRRKRGKAVLRFSPELQALAIRTNKVYLQEIEPHERSARELFLDIEGVPDENFHYLIGLLIAEGDSMVYRSYWAGAKEEEKRIWTDFLEEIGRYPDVPVYHYGRYEAEAIDAFAQRYGGDSSTLMKRLVNVNSWIYGKVYFPVRSNSLKEIGKFLGACWTSPEASGLQALVWRHRWEETCDDKYRQLLHAYNEEDCRALRVLVNAVSKLKNSADSKDPAIELANQPNRHATRVGEEIHRQFDWICRSARADYDRSKISLSPADPGSEERRKRGAPKGHPGYRRIAPAKARRIIRVRPRIKCPRHRQVTLQRSGTLAEHTVVDLAFSKNGCRKFTTRYVGPKAFCSRCQHDYNPRGIDELGGYIFGHALRAWAIHQKIVLRLPYRHIVQVIEDMFGESVGRSSLVHFITGFARDYADTERLLVERLLKSPFIHVDETRLNIEGVNEYVWVFTDGRHVVFRLTETREANVVHEFLTGYQGVLISDFYPGYDSVACAQQKCLVHLIRDLNEDLWKTPFNPEFESFITEVRDLLVPILQTVDKRGLRKWFLRKFKKSVDRFYRKTVLGREYEYEVTRTYQKRFDRYRESLFLFLDHDNIPWNNNMGERAIRELAVQRKISGSFFRRVAEKYLVLLGMAQSCRFQDKSFLKFLVSREKDVDAFRTTKRRRISVAVGPQRPDGNGQTNAPSSPML